MIRLPQNNLTIVYDAEAISIALINTEINVAAVLVGALPLIIVVDVSNTRGVVINVALQKAAELTNIGNIQDLVNLNATLNQLVSIVSSLVSASISVAPGVGDNPDTGINVELQQIVTTLLVILDGLPTVVARAVVILLGRLLGTTTGLANGPLLYSLLNGVLSLLSGVLGGRINRIDLGADLAWVAYLDDEILFSITSTLLVIVRGTIAGTVGSISNLPGGIEITGSSLINLNLGDVVNSLLSTVGDLLNSVGGALSGTLNTVSNLLAGVEGLVNGVLSSVGMLLGGVDNLIGGLLNTVGSILGSINLSGILGGSVSGSVSTSGSSGGLLGGLLGRR